MGTGLLARGLELSPAGPNPAPAPALETLESSADAWSLTRPEQVIAVHREFLAARVDVIQLNSFGLLRLALLGAPVLPLAEASVRCARAALQQEGAAAEVVASLGPSGQPGPLPASVLAAVEDQAEALARLFWERGVGAVHLETFYDPAELAAAMRGVRRGAPRAELWCSVTVTQGHSGGLETPLGIPLASMLRVLEHEKPEGVGVNCSQNARRMLASVSAVFEWSRGSLPLLAQPQVGPSGAECKSRTRQESAEQFKLDALRLLEAGADAVGGCCGCRGEHLAALRGALGAPAEGPGCGVERHQERSIGP